MESKLTCILAGRHSLSNTSQLFQGNAALDRLLVNIINSCRSHYQDTLLSETESIDFLNLIGVVQFI